MCACLLKMCVSGCVFLLDSVHINPFGPRGLHLSKASHLLWDFSLHALCSLQKQWPLPKWKGRRKTRLWLGIFLSTWRRSYWPPTIESLEDKGHKVPFVPTEIWIYFSVASAFRMCPVTFGLFKPLVLPVTEMEMFFLVTPFSRDSWNPDWLVYIW